MFQGTYKRISLTILLLIIVMYGVKKLIYYREGWQLYLEIHYSDKLQHKLPLQKIRHSNEKLLSLPPKEMVNGDKKQPNLLLGEIKQSRSKQQQLSPLLVKQSLLNLVKNQSKFYNYMEHLSPLQVEDLVRQLGVSNLTSRKSQEEFLKCGGMLTLR